MYTVHYDENSDIGTTCLGMPMMRKQDDLRAENKTLITEDCCIPANLLDCTDCKTLLDMGASKSFMAKTF